MQILQENALTSFGRRLFLICLLRNISGLLGPLSAKKSKHEKFDGTNSEPEKKVIASRPKKHQDENASESSEFMHTFSNVYQECSKSTAIRNQYMVLQMAEKGIPAAPLERKNKCNQKSCFSSRKFKILWSSSPIQNLWHFKEQMIAKKLAKLSTVLESRPLHCLEKVLFYKISSSGNIFHLSNKCIAFVWALTVPVMSMSK